MSRHKRHQIIFSILVSLLVYGLTWYGILLTLNNQNSSSLSNFNLSQASPGSSRAILVSQLIAWQINDANLATIDKIPDQKSGKVATRNPNDDHVNLKYDLPVKNQVNTQTRNFCVDQPVTVYNLASVTNYQKIDIPPPYISAS